MKHKSKVLSVILCFILTINGFTGQVHASSVEDNNTNAQQEAGNQNAEWPEGPSVTANAAVVMDAETGLVLYDKDGTDKHYPASITKILTSLVAIENSSLAETVTFSKNAVFSIEKGSSSCAIDWGEELSLEDCLYGILLESGNDVSNAVAEHVGGTIEDFVQMMNDKAKELGCVNSHFANPHGLSDDEHYTCAYDMALIATKAIRNTSFAKIVSTRMHTVAPTNKQPETRYWLNHHKFINKDLKYDDCIGGKTGYTSKSRYTLVTYARRNGMTLVCVIMDEGDPKMQYTETAKLLDYGFDNFSITHICEEGQNELIQDDVFFNKYNSALSGADPLLSVSTDAYVILPSGVKITDAQKTVDFAKSGTVNEVDNTSVIGSVKYTYLDKVIGSGDIILNRKESQLPTGMTSMIETTAQDEITVSSVDTSDQSVVPNVTVVKEKKKNLKPYIIAVIIGSLAILIAVYYFTVERPRIKRRKAYLEHRKNRKLF